VATVGTVEDFWGVINNIPPPTALPPGSNYYFFKEDCYPEMENEVCVCSRVPVCVLINVVIDGGGGG
jgi:hypothetical protein